MTAHIVVVEDEPGLLDLFDTLLRSEGFTVTMVSRPTLVEATWPSVVDLFLIDLRLPGCDGTSLADWLSEHGFPDTPMIGTSASSLEVRRAARSGRFKVVLPKPFDTSELVSCVHSYVGPETDRSRVTQLSAHQSKRAKARAARTSK